MDTVRKLVLIGLMMVSCQAQANSQNLRQAPPLDRLLGTKVINFTRMDASSGKLMSLDDLGDRKAVILVFTGIDCPIGNLLFPRLVELQLQYRDQGVAFLAINSNASETAEAVTAHATEYHANFPVLLDPDASLAGQLDARSSCEVLLLDQDRTIRYRGAVDDQYDYGIRRERTVHPYLVQALDAYLSGRPIETVATTVAGCPIERAQVNLPEKVRIREAHPDVIEAYQLLEGEVDPASLGPVSYASHVAPLLREKCQTCHRPGQVAGFSLLTYDDARRWSAGIAQVVEERRMPPWHADPRYGKFVNDRHLSPQERATLLTWVDQGTPRGDVALEPLPHAWPEGWSIGSPDIVFEMPAEYTVKPEGVLSYQRFRVSTGFTEDRWVQAIEPRPGDRSVVHHIVVYLRDPNSHEQRGKADLEHLAAYAPGDIPTVLPSGVAKRVPAGAELIIEVHYTPIGKTRTDRSSVGMIFAKKPPQFRAITIPILNQRFEIPAGAGNHEVRSSFTVPKEMRLIGFLPHMHLRGKDFTYSAKLPGIDQKPEILLSVPRYDFAWQSCYWLTEPKKLPQGTQIECVAHFDNSGGNRALTAEQIRHPVRWGDQTWEEMMIGYIDTLVPVGQEAEPKTGDHSSNISTSP